MEGSTYPSTHTVTPSKIDDSASLPFVSDAVDRQEPNAQDSIFFMLLSKLLILGVEITTKRIKRGLSVVTHCNCRDFGNSGRERSRNA
jgi:hypothetical protein